MRTRTTRALLALVTVAATLVVSQGVASAHVPAISAVCGKATVSASSYPSGSSVKVSVDGSQVDSASFNGSFGPKSYTFSKTATHVVTAAFKSPDDPTGSHGWTKTLSATAPKCEEQATTTTQAPTTTTTAKATTTTVKATTTTVPATTTTQVKSTTTVKQTTTTVPGSTTTTVVAPPSPPREALPPTFIPTVELHFTG